MMGLLNIAVVCMFGSIGSFALSAIGILVDTELSYKIAYVFMRMFIILGVLSIVVFVTYLVRN